MADNYLNSLQQRRTHYDLGDTSPIPDQRILEIAETIVKHTPSSLNSQASRYVLLLGDQHKRLWSMVLETMEKVETIDVWTNMIAPKLSKLKGGYGTILLYEDRAVVSAFEARFPRYGMYIPQFAEHCHGMQAIHLWTALSLEGLGCNLQHFNPHIDSHISAMWKVPETWSLKAQLVFGNPKGEPNPNKTFAPIKDRVMVFGSEAALRD